MRTGEPALLGRNWAFAEDGRVKLEEQGSMFFESHEWLLRGQFWPVMAMSGADSHREGKIGWLNRRSNRR